MIILEQNPLFAKVQIDDIHLEFDLRVCLFKN